MKHLDATLQDPWWKNPQNTHHCIVDALTFRCHFFPPEVKHKTVGTTGSKQSRWAATCSLSTPEQSTKNKLLGVCDHIYLNTFGCRGNRIDPAWYFSLHWKEGCGQKRLWPNVWLDGSAISLNCCQNGSKKNWAQERIHKAFRVLLTST